MIEYYAWIKAAHLFAVISWMAGMLYLPRLLVYHRDAVVGGEASEMLKVMERRLLAIIMGPAIGATWVLGLLLVFLLGSFDVWLMVKLVAVVAMSGLHGWLGAFVKQFARDQRPRNARFFRMLNEVPAVLMAVIVVMVIVKPFG